MSDWQTAKVLSKRRAADGLVHLILDVEGTPLAGAHAVAGQYVKLTLEGHKEAFFALASAPGEDRFELLLKTGAPLADAVVALADGATVQISAPAGKGFPLDQAEGKQLLLFATGSGISPIRSVVSQVRLERAAFGPVTLFFGVRTPSNFAFEDEFHEWEAEGIKVVRTVSQPGASGWKGLTGYVQTHLTELGEGDLSGAVAFLVGQKAMVQGVTEALLRRGMKRESVFLNF
jgi:sulfhydrogenase subunit gamma (sulfur reductase)